MGRQCAFEESCSLVGPDKEMNVRLRLTYLDSYCRRSRTKQRSHDARLGPDGRCDCFQRPPGGKRISRLSSFALCESGVLGPQSTASAVARLLVADGAYVAAVGCGLVAGRQRERCGWT